MVKILNYPVKYVSIYWQDWYNKVDNSGPQLSVLKVMRCMDLNEIWNRH